MASTPCAFGLFRCDDAGTLGLSHFSVQVDHALSEEHVVCDEQVRGGRAGMWATPGAAPSK